MIPVYVYVGTIGLCAIVCLFLGWLQGTRDMKRARQEAQVESHSAGYQKGHLDGSTQGYHDGYKKGVEYGHAHPIRDHGRFTKLHKENNE